jgi:D-glucosaminate-6-phosphate ammonia-lyase
MGITELSVYQDLGVRTIINAVGPATRLGGVLMEPEVLQAMAEAAAAFVRIDELQEAAARVIADVTGAESGYVTSGAASGLTLATAACMTGTDPTKINQLPDTAQMKHEVVIQRSQRYAYDHAFRAAGAKLVEIGFPDLTFPYELDKAIGPNTAAVAYFPVHSRACLPIEETVAIAHRHNVPVIVDAALEVPPSANLRTFTQAGADLIVFSGGKAIGGPQASGIVAGRADLIQAIALHHQDMDVRIPTWKYRDQIKSGVLIGPPHHGIGRGMKVGKEEIAGLVVALKRYVSRDHRADQENWLRKVAVIKDQLRAVPGVVVEVPIPEPEAIPVARIELDEEELGVTAYSVLNRLHELSPPIFLDEEHAWRGVLIVNPMGLRAGEEMHIAQQLVEALGRRG